ncbi:MAG: FkbM family methyltransferase [Ruminococcus sp.]|nr:FkbM family methyltransferase [Ruminococcus sp.]
MISDILKEESSWEVLSTSQKPVVLYGTGNGADMVLDEFHRLGIQVAGIVASDGFVRKRSFRGFTVQSISQIENELGDFIVALGFATCIPQVMESIRELSLRHHVLVPVVPVFGDEIFNRQYLEEHLSTLEESRSLLCDEESKRVFDNMIRFQFTGELSYLFSIESQREAALRDILCLTDKEDMLDLGAYRGDTIKEVISLFGGISSAIALEPDKKTFEKLCTFAKNFPCVTPLPYAVWSEIKELSFSGGGGRQSALNSEGKDNVRAVSADSITERKRITYVKMDVEGVEKEALLGMSKLLNDQKPKLSIAAYHRTCDLAELIPLIHRLNPQYRIHLRHHPYIPCWDTNLYCV